MTSIESTRHAAPESHDDAFDAAMRGRHAQALDAVSPRVTAQLQQRRRAAMAGVTSGSVPARRAGWAMGAAMTASFAALLAVAIGVQSPSTSQPSGSAPLVATSAADADARYTAALDGDGANDGSILDENPDFYAWLASSDANNLAME